MRRAGRKPRVGRPGEDRTPTTMRLTAVTRKQIAALARRWKCDKTAAVERAIHEVHTRVSAREAMAQDRGDGEAAPVDFDRVVQSVINEVLTACQRRGLKVKVGR